MSEQQDMIEQQDLNSGVSRGSPFDRPEPRRSHLVHRLLLAVALLLAGALFGAFLIGSIGLGKLFNDGPDPVVIANSSLQSVREQARLTPFVARFVAVTTATQSRFGLKAQRTLIMPGTVRYEVDLSRIGPEDLRWDAASETLSIALPPLELSGPEINLSEIREYGGGGLLSKLTDARSTLDAANRARGQQELLRQASQPLPLKLARDAAKRAIERSFALPMKAAGIDAKVVASFAGESAPDPSYLDRSRRIEDVLRERRERAQ
jgi:hypothetical protein